MLPVARRRFGVTSEQVKAMLSAFDDPGNLAVLHRRFSTDPCESCITYLHRRYNVAFDGW